jgi:hypothetical protein
MRKTVSALTAFALLFAGTGCVSGGQDRPIPDQTIPHRVSRTMQVPLWVRTPNGGFTEGWYTIHEGWWVASPAMVEADNP